MTFMKCSHINCSHGFMLPRAARVAGGIDRRDFMKGSPAAAALAGAGHAHPLIVGDRGPWGLDCACGAF